MQLLVEFQYGGHHPLLTGILLGKGFDGYFLTSPELWEILPDEIKTRHRAKVTFVPGIAWDRKAQVEAIYSFIDKHPDVTGCFYVSLSEIFRPLLGCYAWKLLSGKVCIPVSGIWIANNLYFSRNDNIWKRGKFVCLFGCLALLLLLFKRQRIMFVSKDFHSLFKNWPVLRSKVSWCPEPVEESAHGRVGSTESSRATPGLLFAGFHSVRKNTRWALETLLGWREPLRVVVAGRMDPALEIQEIAKRFTPPVTCETHDRWISRDELAELFVDSSVVVLPYVDFAGSSSVLVNALHFNKPLLVTDWGMMGQQVKEMRCGRTFKPNDPSDFLEQLKSLLGEAMDLRNNEQVRTFLAERTPEEFFLAVTKAMRFEP